MTRQTHPSSWQRPPLIERRALRWLLTGLIPAYLLVVLLTLDVPLARVMAGWPRASEMATALFSPDFVSRGDAIWLGLKESLAMSFAATFLGFLLAIPFAFGAAGNISPRSVYHLSRAVIAVSRSFQEIIIAILFVAMLGFGPLAGLATLVFAGFGFIAKLAAEDIEAMPPATLEAMRASGASWAQQMVFGVWPFLLPRLTGITLYRLDINFRESAVIGIVGAGGIGATLNTALDRFEYNSAAAIIILIVVIVLAAEYLSQALRRQLR